MTQEEQIRADLARFNATGELPAAWAPEIDDTELDEINRDPDIAALLSDHLAEQDAIESGCYEPCRIGCVRPCCARGDL